MNYAPISDAASLCRADGGIAPTRWNRLENDQYFTIESAGSFPRSIEG